MTRGGTAPTRAEAMVIGLTVVCLVFVAVSVNVLIYTARWDFIALHPVYSANNPPTISRALSDPSVGEPFANWMLICAPVLFIGITLLLASGLWPVLRNRLGDPAFRVRLVVLCGLAWVLQFLASSGMVMLSQYRFPDFGPQHMSGSYLFFFSQAMVVGLGEVLSRYFARLPAHQSPVADPYTLWRRRFIWVVVVLSVGYLALFVIKNFALGAVSKPIYTVYVSTELILISSFLLYMVFFVPDCLVAIRRHLRA